MSSNVEQVEAATVVDPNCGVVDQKPSGKCDVDIDYDGICNSSSINCNIDIDVVTNPQPRGNNELKLDYHLETGIKCNKVAGGLAGKTACLANTHNDYKSCTTINRETGTTSDNQFNFKGSQQVYDTARQDNFITKNDMQQNIIVNTQGAKSVIDTDGSGDNFQLKYLQDIVEPDDTSNTNVANQLVSLKAENGGKIDTSEHSELGFNVEQRLLDIDDHDTNQATSPITATNRANQILGIDSDNGAAVNYDTDGLSRISQTIDDCSFGQANCLNEAGDPATTNTGQVVQLTAKGAGDVASDGNDRIAGTTIDVDNLQQLVSQNINNFENANQ